MLNHVAGGAFRVILFDFNPLGVAAAMAGLWALVHCHPRFLAFAGLAAVPVVFFAINYPVYDSQFYLLPFYLLTAFPAGWGAGVTVHMARTAAAASNTRLRRLAHAAAVVVVLSLPVVQFGLHRGWVDLSGDRYTHRAYSALLDATPENAVLISGSPLEVLVFWYLQYAWPEALEGPKTTGPTSWHRRLLDRPGQLPAEPGPAFPRRRPAREHPRLCPEALEGLPPRPGGAQPRRQARPGHPRARDLS